MNSLAFRMLIKLVSSLYDTIAFGSGASFMLYVIAVVSIFSGLKFIS